MERSRIVAVEGPSGPGSGYAVASRLVLTSAHVVPPVGGPVRLFRPGQDPVFDGSVVWRGTPGGRDDAALVQIHDPAWIPIAGAVRWGRTVTHQTGIVCVTWGMPEVAQQPGWAVDTLQPSGRLNPGDRFVGNRYVMSLDQPPPRATGRRSKPWGGLSGAALFCGSLLTGVIVSDVVGFSHSRLEAVPAYVLYHDEAFRAALAKEIGGIPPLEPVEWQDLSDDAELALDGELLRSPTALLRARREVVPFHGRTGLLTQLTSWCEQPGFGAWLIHGPAGQGKTRLAQQLVASLDSRRWATLWLSPKASSEQVGMLKDATGRLLVVVDYAESRTEQLTALLEAAALNTGKSAFKILLLARTSGDWWEAARDATAVTEELLDGTAVTELPPLVPAPEKRPQAYREAVGALAAVLPSVRSQHEQPWAELAADLAPVNMEKEEAGNALTLHMTALVDLLDAADRAAGEEPPTGELADGAVDAVEDRLLRHERRYWRTAAKASGLDWQYWEETLKDAMAAGFLCGAEDEEQADVLFGRVLALNQRPVSHSGAVSRVVTAVYPSMDDRPWDGLRPDRLAEHYVGRRLLRKPSLADCAVDGASWAQAEQLLSVYSRAAARPAFGGQLDDSLSDLCVDHRITLTLLAVDVATRVEAPQPLLTALQRITDDPATTSGDLEQMAAHVPTNSHHLAGVAVHLNQRLVDRFRQLDQDDLDHRSDLAIGLNNLSGRLVRLGRPEEALAAATEALEIRRELVRVRPEAIRPLLASSLNNVSVCLANTGRPEEALAAITEAVDIRRSLADTNPDEYLRDFAASLTNLSSDHSRLGNTEESLAAIHEAVRINRVLTGDRRSDPRLQDLADSLIGLSGRLTDQGRLEEALDAITEAIGILRELAETRPDSYRSRLATALDTFSLRLADLGLLKEAEAAIGEAVDILRGLARTWPDAYLSDLAGALNSHSNRLAELGRHKEGHAAISEAVQICEDRVQARPDAYQPALALYLNTLSNRLGEMGQATPALLAISRAERIYRELAGTWPARYRPDLALSLNDLSVRLGDVGRVDEALAAITEAVEIRRELARTQPDAYLPWLAMSLNNQCVQLSVLGRRQEALTAVSEAVRLYRQLVRTRPDAYLHYLASGLNNQSKELAALDWTQEALAAVTDAVRLYRDLIRTNRDAHLPNLATSLENLSDQLREAGREEEARAALREGVDLRREFARTRPDVHLPNLARNLNTLSVQLGMSGSHEEAFAAAVEAVEVCRELVRQQADDYQPLLAMNLNSLSNRLADLGRREEALAASDEGVEIYRELSRAHPGAYFAEQAASLQTLSRRLAALGRDEEAARAAAEAVLLYRQLATGQPQTHLASLAMGLKDLALRLADLGRLEESFAAIDEATDIQRSLKP